jgi:N-acetylglucosamine-6-phosphate deacetylase
MATITARRVLAPTGWLHGARIGISRGIITGIQAHHGSFDVHTVSPGFVDLQVNGVDDIDCSAARDGQWTQLDELLVAQGVTAWCPTLVTMPLEAYHRPLARIGEAIEAALPGSATILGAHLEGPFLGGAPGAHPPSLLRDADLDWLASLPAHVRMVTLAAEQPTAVAATRLLAEHGVLVSIGHTTAPFERLDWCAAAGASMVTHLFNGMSGLHHRSPGVAAWALAHPTVSASMIADGVHVHPLMLALAARLLGGERMVLVTDSVAWRAGTAGSIGVQMSDGAPRLADGTLAGSAVTMDQAVRTCVEAGIAVEHALWAASRNPARLAAHPAGELRVGAPADLVALDADLAVQQVWVGGVARR